MKFQVGVLLLFLHFNTMCSIVSSKTQKNYVVISVVEMLQLQRNITVIRQESEEDAEPAYCF